MEINEVRPGTLLCAIDEVTLHNKDPRIGKRLHIEDTTTFCKGENAMVVSKERGCVLSWPFRRINKYTVYTILKDKLLTYFIYNESGKEQFNIYHYFKVLK